MPPDEPAPKASLLHTIFSRRMLVSFAMGFASGLPLLLTIGVLQAWMKEEGVDLSVIGLFALVQLPYTLKFLWAPLFDRFVPPFLGRRRGWLLITQFLLIGATVGLGMTDPGASPQGVAIAALLVAFFSASQDIVIDAYRREDLADHELGLGSSFYVYGYRLGMVLAGGGGLILADHMSFRGVYAAMGACMLVGVVTTLLTPEPRVTQAPPTNVKEAVIDPFVEYFRRHGAVLMLLFIMFYKMGDWMATTLTVPFYLDLGFTKTEIGAITKVFGFWMILAGVGLGGLLMLRLGINRSLWIFGFLQMVSTAGFAVLAQVGYSLPLLTAVISFENLSMGMGTSALTAFMGAQTNKRFTATQFALLSSLIAVPRSAAAATTGFIAEAVGWSWFFITCTLIALPGLALLYAFAPWRGSVAEIEPEIVPEVTS